jgi:putative ABC transport system permease protein
MADSKTLYRLLLKLYSARFREEYEKPLERQFWDEYNQIHGHFPRMLFWMSALADLALSIPVEVLHELRQDLGYALRVYRKRSFTLTLALVALALTIGVATGVFSIVNALLFRSLPFRDPERLVQLHNFQSAAPSAAGFHAWATSRPYLTDAAGYRTENMTLTAARQARRVKVAETSSNFFRLLGSEPFIGRDFASGEDTQGLTDVAIVGYGLWQQLGADPRILGSIIHVNGVPLKVIGVGPSGLNYPGKSALWVPKLYFAGHLSRARALTWVVNGRLKPGISLPQASAQFHAENIALAKSAGRKLDPDALAGFRLISLRDQLAGNARQISFVLFGIVMFVLLTACANVAHLLLSRITERSKELVLRAALGASRGRLMQQLVTETTALTVAAAVAGLVVAQWVARLALAVQPPSLTTQAYTVLDLPVLLFAVGIAILTGLVFGVLPAGFIRRMQPAMGPLRLAAGHRVANLSARLPKVTKTRAGFGCFRPRLENAGRGASRGRVIGVKVSPLPRLQRRALA